MPHTSPTRRPVPASADDVKRLHELNHRARSANSNRPQAQEGQMAITKESKIGFAVIGC